MVDYVDNDPLLEMAKRIHDTPIANAQFEKSFPFSVKGSGRYAFKPPCKFLETFDNGLPHGTVKGLQIAFTDFRKADTPVHAYKYFFFTSDIGMKGPFDRCAARNFFTNEGFSSSP